MGKNMCLSDRTLAVVLFILGVFVMTLYHNHPQIYGGCPQSNNRIPLTDRPPLSAEKQAANAAQEERVLYLSKLLKERLEAVTEGGPANTKLVCEEINSTAPCRSRYPCARPWENRTAEERVRELVTTPRLQLSPEQLDSVLKLSRGIPEKDLIIASAVSANHFDEMQAMFKNLHEMVYPKIKNFAMVLFDLGMSPMQRNITRKNCQCWIVPFNFELFPPHVSDLRCFSWKPLVFRALITKARKLLVYQDSSIRWNNNFPEIFERALKYGQQTIRPKYGDNIPSNSMKQTLDYFNEDSCTMRMFFELQAGIQMNRNDPLIVEALMNPWTKCALEESCICPRKPSAIINCHGSHLHRCHRFDQSAFNTVMAKLYGPERYKMAVPHSKMPLKIARGDRTTAYFKT